VMDVIANPKIKNREKLLSHGDVESRRIVLDITEATLKRMDSYHRIKSIMRVEGTYLHIGVKSWDLSRKKNVYLIGGGKACNAMAMAIEEILGDRLTAGIAVVKLSEPNDSFTRTRVFVGGHPLPNQDGLQACKEIFKLVDGACADDLFICVMSGGSSALMSCPVEGLTLQDEIDTTDLLLKSGANIIEINSVRRHISQMNGGRLAERISSRGSELIGFNISDAVTNPPTKDINVPWPNFYGTPMGPDQTTLENALQVIRDYNLADRLPERVLHYLQSCGPGGETPKAFPRNTYFQLNTLPDSCAYAREIAEDMGLPVMVLTTFIEGESKEFGSFFASIAREIQHHGRPIAPPCVVLSAGEAVTTILDSRAIKGHGGPSQEMVIGFAIGAEKAKGACMLSIDTEGTDGTTLAAGGIADSKSAAEARRNGVDLFDALRGHASFEALTGIGDCVITGNTGTNVCDFNIMYVPPLEDPSEK
ncbi:MAG TPA: DUF4147 domain-containing protein, partial [Anaerovoracaceae bacterium]|nr:DUF4147 domain-containing protein [Anaerovoracaceae bacterium]